MSGHTPAPWEQHGILSNSENDKGFRVTAHDGRDGRMWIADVSPVIDNERGDASEEGKANARLIAAAPDLLEALKECSDRLRIHMKHTEDLMADMKAQKAIAKAEGR